MNKLRNIHQFERQSGFFLFVVDTALGIGKLGVAYHKYVLVAENVPVALHDFAVDLNVARFAK